MDCQFCKKKKYLLFFKGFLLRPFSRFDFMSLPRLQQSGMFGGVCDKGEFLKNISVDLS